MGRLKQEMEEAMVIAGYAPSTVRLYVTCTGAYARHFGISPLELGARDLESFLLYLRREGRSDSTVHIYYESIRTFYALRGMKGRVPVIHFTHKGRRVPRVPSRSVVMAFLEGIPGLRLRLALTLAYSGGLRISELLALRLRDLDFERGIVHVARGKGGKARQSLLAPGLRPLLDTYLSVYRPRDLLFFRHDDPDAALSASGIQRAFRSLARGVPGMEGCTVHSLRHCFATHLVEEGVGIFHVMRLLGHSSVQSTMVYLKAASLEGLGLRSPYEGPRRGLGRDPEELDFLETA